MAVRVLMLAACFTLAWAQQRDYTTPIPILKQINRQNEDGSYSYGYEGADGSYKIETKHPTGEVYGKYGFVDDAGQLREVEYGASRRGFEPAGTDINVAPPTLTNNYVGSTNGDVDDGQYREDPSVYWKDPKYNGAQSQSRQQYSQPKYTQNQPQYNPPQSQYNPPQSQYNPPQSQYNPPQSQYNPPQYSQSQYSQPRYTQPIASQYKTPQNFDYQQDNYDQRSYFNSQPQYRPQISVDPNIFRGHPATNFDVSSGSYSVQYKK